MTTSEMTTADIALWRTEKSRRRLDLDSDEGNPRVVQIAGSEPQRMALAAKLCIDRGAQIIDINMGCPAKKVCRRATGSTLLRKPPLVARILAAMFAAVDVPVILKIRTGWDQSSKNGLEISRIAEDTGIQALAMRGRTRTCKYKGAAEYETVAQIKDIL